MALSVDNCVMSKLKLSCLADCFERAGFDLAGMLNLRGWPEGGWSSHNRTNQTLESHIETQTPPVRPSPNSNFTSSRLQTNADELPCSIDIQQPPEAAVMCGKFADALKAPGSRGSLQAAKEICAGFCLAMIPGLFWQLRGL